MLREELLKCYFTTHLLWKENLARQKLARRNSVRRESDISIINAHF